MGHCCNRDLTNKENVTIPDRKALVGGKVTVSGPFLGGYS